MNHLASGRTRLLVRPEINENESLRGYISRVSRSNGSSLLFKPALASLQATTNALPEIATMTGRRASDLMAHGSLTQLRNDEPPGVLFGSCILSTNRVRMQRRNICPMCLSKDGISISCWELRGYDVCHKHGCYLVDRCSGCDRILSWSNTSSDICLCGLQLADMKTELASINQGLICKLIADHMPAMISRPNEVIVSGILSPLNLFFIAGNFVRAVLIPSFCRWHLGNLLSLSSQASEELLLVILQDSEYCIDLHKVIIAYCIENPKAMARALMVGITDLEMREHFLPCLDKVIIHNELFKIKADVIEKRRIDFNRYQNLLNDLAEQPGWIPSAIRREFSRDVCIQR